MISKKIILASLLITGGLVAGCSMVDGTPKSSGGSEISEEAFAKAFDDYIAKNEVAFGGKVVNAANAYQTEQQKNAQADKEAKMKSVPNPTEKDHVKGADSPEFIMFEYSDYHCPYCQKFYPIGEEFVKKNPNVQLVFRALPLAHANTAGPLHEIAECIAKNNGNDAFWKFTDAVFADASISADNYMTTLAKYNIAGAESIKACYESGEMKSVVQKSVEDAMAMGIQGTPNNILKNVKTGEIRLLEGAYPLSELEKAMNELKK